jgi:hypothetical protein
MLCIAGRSGEFGAEMANDGSQQASPFSFYQYVIYLYVE